MILVSKNQQTDEYILRLERGEELVETLLSFCTAHQIRNAVLQGIGAGNHVEIGWYDFEQKIFIRKIYDEDLELLSLIGNIAPREGVPQFHAHVSLGRKDYSVIGGHLFSLHIWGAGEIVLRNIHQPFERRFDSATGLSLLCPSNF